MCSKQYCAYTLFAVLVMCWALQVEFRNDQFPEVREVVLETHGSRSQVQYLISNPYNETKQVATHVRLQSAEDDDSTWGAFRSPVTVAKYNLEPNSVLNVDLYVENAGLWSEADVQLYLLDDAEDLSESQLDRLGRLAIERFQEFVE